MSEQLTINTPGQITTRAQTITGERDIDNQISVFQGKCGYLDDVYRVRKFKIKVRVNKNLTMIKYNRSASE